MSEIEIKARWRLTTPLHPGTGLSRPGIADRIVERGTDGRPVLKGDRIKGAIRLSAERLCGWYAPHLEPSGHPAVQNIFYPERMPIYRFLPATLSASRPAFRASATSVGTTGVAGDQTLRIIENWAAGLEFVVQVKGRGGDWISPRAPDFPDLVLLCAAILATDSLGGSRTSQGLVQCLSIETDPALNLDWSMESVEQNLAAYLRR